MYRYLGQLKSVLISFFVKKTVGARALVIKDGKVLLIKHSYAPGWYTIGGAVDKGETPIVAVQRELDEEVGIQCLTPPKLFSVYLNLREKRDDYVILYLIENFSKQQINSIEVAEEKWFKLDELPHDISPATLRRIEEFRGIRIINEQW